MNADLYDQDYGLWLEQNAELLRAGRISEADMDHIAEEIEALAGNQRRELDSRIGQILEHLLKLDQAEGQLLDYNRRGWRRSIALQQNELRTLFRQSPSLRRFLTSELLAARYHDAARLFEIEYAPKLAPVACQYTWRDVLGE